MAYEITRGSTSKPVKCCCYGSEGVGKTTFAAKWPGAVFIDIEDGSGHYDVARLPRPQSWPILLDELMAVATMPEVGTLVIDTADAAEALCIAEVLKRHKCSGIEQVGGGYGKGYTYLAEEFSKLLKSLDRIIEAGKNVVVLAHAQIKKFEQPDELGAYDRWELKLQKKCAPLVKEWCDLLLFANYATDVMTSKDGKKVKAKGGKKRVMYASHTASWDAKNRLGLPDEMPFDFESIADVIPSAEKRPEGETAKPEQPDEQAKQGGDIAQKIENHAETQEYLHEIASGNLDAKPPASVAPPIEFEEVTEPEVLELHKCMELSGVNESMLRAAVAAMSNNPYTEETTIAEYSIKFVGNLVKHWDAIIEKVKEISDVYGNDIPF